MTHEREPHIHVLVLQPGQRPEVRTIENKLEAFQTIVQGKIEIFDLGVPGLEGVCNDEFLSLDMAPTCLTASGAFICGPMFIAAPEPHPRDGVVFRSLTESEINPALGACRLARLH